MAVYTKVDDDALKNFLESYDIGALISVRGIAEGVENSNFHLYTTTGHYILTLYEKRTAEADLPFFLTLMQHLACRSLACPRPIVQRDQALIGRLAGRPAAILSLLEGSWLTTPQIQHCQQVGKALAQLHAAALDFPLSRPNALSVMGWRPLWQSVSERANEFGAEIRSAIEKELDFLNQNWPANLPVGIIHADLFTDNVLFNRDTLTGIIDFYFACHDILAYDIAIAINAWCFNSDWSYDRAKAQALLHHYQGVRILNRDEIAAMPILTRGAALRFFLTRLYDWFNTSNQSLVMKKDPLEYWQKLNFFVTVSNATELGF